MGQLLFYALLAITTFVVLGWDTDIKPRIFKNPDAVKLRPEFKYGLLIYVGCFTVAFWVFVILLMVLPDSDLLRICSGVLLFAVACFCGNVIKKRSFRRVFFDCSIARRMNPEDYARTMCPGFVIQYIDSHLHDKRDLEAYIKHQRKLRNISDPCAWAFLVAYCDKDPNAL